MGFCISWLDEEKTLALGPCLTEGHLHLLMNEGINAVLSLQEHHLEGISPLMLRKDPHFSWTNIAIKDGGEGGWDGVPTVEMISAAVEQIRAWHREGRRVYIHCRLGIGRAPTVAMAYLIMGRGMHIAHAIARVVERRPESDPSVYQLSILTEYVRRVYEAEFYRRQPQGSGRP
jgi:predicted protein tyrosine phosphatase